MSKKLVNFFAQFDIDCDGLLSYPEFLLVLALLSVPLRDMRSIFTMMDTDGNGTVEKDEFCRLIDSLENVSTKHSSLVPRTGFKSCVPLPLPLDLVTYDGLSSEQSSQDRLRCSNLHLEQPF